MQSGRNQPPLLPWPVAVPQSLECLITNDRDAIGLPQRVQRQPQRLQIHSQVISMQSLRQITSPHCCRGLLPVAQSLEYSITNDRHAAIGLPLTSVMPIMLQG